MSKYSYRVCSISHERLSYEQISSNDDGLSRKSSKQIKENLITSSRGKSSKRQKQRNENDVYRIFQALLLLTCVLSLSYQSVRNDRMIYGLLENGATIYGYATFQKREGTIVAMTLGYSLPRSIAYTATSLMLVYSLISGRPRWSFPLLALFLADLVRDASKAILIIFLSFQRFHFTTACYYTATILLLIAGEIWTFMGVLSYHEHKLYE